MSESGEIHGDILDIVNNIILNVESNSNVHTNIEDDICNKAEKELIGSLDIDQLDEQDKIIEPGDENEVIDLPYECPECGQKFSSEYVVMDHYAIQHEHVYPQYECD